MPDVADVTRLKSEIESLRAGVSKLQGQISQLKKQAKATGDAADICNRLITLESTRVELECKLAGLLSDYRKKVPE